MNHMIAGYGEIGQAVNDVLDDGVSSIYVVDPRADIYNENDRVTDILHICFPYSEGFVAAVVEYMNDYSPDHVIVYSTVPIGTCEKIGKNVVHSPIEGKHPDLELSIRTMERWLGTADKAEGQFFTQFFESLSMRVKVVGSSKFTEALKLLSTAEYGVNLVFADYKAEVADDIGMPYGLTREWNLEYNRLYRELGMGTRFQKFVLDAPNGKIGGHCVVPNSKLLNEDYPNDMLDLIEEME